MLEDALAFPTNRDGWLRTVVVGGLLSLLGVLVVPAIVVNGYYVRVLRAGIEGDDEPPGFSGWGRLFVDGLVVLVIEVVYVGLPLLALVLGIGLVTGLSVLSSGLEDGGSVLAGVGAVGGLGAIAVVAVMALVSYLLPAALARYAATGEASAAFAFRRVLDVAFTGDYLVAVLLAVAVSVVLGLVGSVLLIVFVGVFVLFYLQVVVYYLFGRGYAAAASAPAT